MRNLTDEFILNYVDSTYGVQYAKKGAVLVTKERDKTGKVTTTRSMTDSDYELQELKKRKKESATESEAKSKITKAQEDEARNYKQIEAEMTKGTDTRGYQGFSEAEKKAKKQEDVKNAISKLAGATYRTPKKYDGGLIAKMQDGGSYGGDFTNTTFTNDTPHTDYSKLRKTTAPITGVPLRTPGMPT